ncbi:MAG: dihydrodipicolinate synthase family protein [Candidatus Hydrogenedentes bacterium]|nr:dihydrodipicolinate synthase family protein [Candidatus Hydrogenedentota bacterium]
MKVPDYVHGCISPVFTCFHENGDLDDAGQRNLLDFLHRTDAVSAYFVRSGMGQMYTFDMDDTKQLARNACSHMSGKGPVLVGCAGIWNRNRDKRPNPDQYIEQAIELSQYAESVGAAGVVHTVPEGLNPAAGESIPEAVERYFTAVCESVKVPVLMYQPPNTDTKYWLSPKLLAKLADIDNMIGLKVSNADGWYTFDLIRAVAGKDFGFIAGDERAFYANLYAGARAVIGQGTSLNPQILKLELERYLAGDQAGVIVAQESVNLLCATCRNPVDFLKHYAKQQGFAMGRTARRITEHSYISDSTPLSKDEYQSYKQILEGELARFGFAPVCAA